MTGNEPASPRLKDGWAHGDASAPGMTIAQTALLHFMANMVPAYDFQIDAQSAKEIAHAADQLTTAFINQINKNQNLQVAVNLDAMNENTTTIAGENEVHGKNIFGNSSDPALNAKVDTIDEPGDDETEGDEGVVEEASALAEVD
ncbi:hypothetical protein DXN05_03560 [Deminuibacter soli]|uniref:Uncharacterized protein n=1 Tax=Deminuibacter soli TaxID=2291815 RepID=A0A3E1NQ55_9BACT|nr:hypothetical protein DXN05_03560 [Deminuibacter soli]